MLRGAGNGQIFTPETKDGRHFKPVIDSAPQLPTIRSAPTQECRAHGVARMKGWLGCCFGCHTPRWPPSALRAQWRCAAPAQLQTCSPHPAQPPCSTLCNLSFCLTISHFLIMNGCLVVAASFPHDLIMTDMQYKRPGGGHWCK